MLDRGLRVLRAAAGGEGGLPRSRALRALHASRRASAARGSPPRGCRPTRPARSRPGSGACAATRPPPLYAFDPDIGRLAVTTPAYNTAIVAVNQRAFPYGGIELARLFDGEQRVAANVGGRAPAAFGLLVREPNGRRVFSSQTGARRASTRRSRRCGSRGRRRGPGRPRARAPGGKVFAGPFKDLRARGTLTAGRFRAVTSHRFTPSTIETQLAARAPLRARAAARRRRCCRAGARERPRRGGAARRLARQPARRGAVRARAGRALRDREPRSSGYTVVPLRRPAGAVARVLIPSRQSSNPDPGPTLAIEIAHGSTWRRASLRRPDRRRRR